MTDTAVFEVTPGPGGGWIVSRPVSQLVREWRSERVARVAAGGTPLPLEAGAAAAVLHFIPHAAFSEGAAMDLSVLDQARLDLSPLAQGGFDQRFNADGFLTWYPGAEGKASAYLQLFREGAIETASTALAGTTANGTVVRGRRFEKEVLKTVARCVGAADVLGVAPPWSVAVSMVHARGVRVARDGSPFWGDGDGGHAVDRDTLLAPPVLLRDKNADLSSALRPAFDFVWQAAGRPRSPHYDEAGDRAG